MEEYIDFFPIQVEQTNWTTSEQILSDIRAQVFIEEQQVPVEEEFDDLDLSASHWIAWGENQTPMGVARLVGNRIGRMAVLPAYRGKGVGSALLRAILAHAISQKLAKLELSAQLHAVGFYENNGFEVTGNEFMDVGIAHVPMAMDLERFTHRRHEPPPPDISEELRHHHQIDGQEEFRWAALQLARHTERSIRIFSERLDPAIYDNEEFCHAVFNLVVSHPNSKVMLLVKDTDWLSRHFHRLMETCHKLPSHIELKRLTNEIDTPHQEFMTGNLHSVLYAQSPRYYQGYLCLYAPVETKRLNEEFDILWHHSEPDPQIRRLHI
jgi:predicted GNAT family N-acyltransferase